MTTLFYGGNIITMSEPMRPEAILLDESRIISAGPKEELLKLSPDCKQKNLEGHTLIPGFIDPHSHFFQVAISLLRVPLGGIKAIPEMEEAVSHFIAKNKIAQGQWLMARDYDNNIMPGLKNPSLQELDRIAPNNPLVIHFKSGHMGLFNSMALDKLHITADTPSPEGGLIEKVNGALTGYLEENAFFTYLQKIPMAEPQQLLNAFCAAQEEYASYGITTLQDGMVVEQMLPMYEALLKQDMLFLDVILYSAPQDYEKTKSLLEKYPDNKHLHLGGMKIFLDGSPQGRTAWMRQPYAGDPDYCGYGTMSDDAVLEAFRAAAKAKTQLIAHCNGDAAADQFLRCLEAAEIEYPILRELRPVIIHGQLMGADQVKKAKKLGAMISFFIAHIYHWGEVHVRNFGMDRASRISPAGTAMEAGVNVTFHQDSPVIDPNMLETIWCAVNRRTQEGTLLGNEERITPLEAIQAVTVNGANQYGINDIGRLAPGCSADMAILSQDPTQIPIDEIRNIRVVASYKAGKSVYAV